jgi:hypothetical protein
MSEDFRLCGAAMDDGRECTRDAEHEGGHASRLPRGDAVLVVIENAAADAVRALVEAPLLARIQELERGVEDLEDKNGRLRAGIYEATSIANEFDRRYLLATERVEKVERELTEAKTPPDWYQAEYDALKKERDEALKRVAELECLLARDDEAHK